MTGMSDDITDEQVQQMIREMRECWAQQGEELTARWEHKERGRKFLEQHREEWRTQYPDSWLAIRDDCLVAADPDFDAFDAKVDCLDFPRDEMHFEFLDREHVNRLGYAVLIQPE
jgi:hypothetical protein